MENYKVFGQAIKEFYSLEETNKEVQKGKKEISGKVHLEPRIICSNLNNSLKLEIYIGEKNMYKIKSIPEFYDRFMDAEKYKYGAKLEIVHTKERFAKEDQKLLEFVLKYAEIIKYANESSTGYDYYTKRLGEDSIILSNTGLDELFECLIDKSIEMDNQYSTERVLFVDKEPEIKFKLKQMNQKEYKIITNIDVYDYTIYDGRKYVYILIKNKLYRCSKKYRNTVIKLLEIFKKNFTKEIILPESDLSKFFVIIEPNIKNNIEISDAEYKKIKKFIPPQLYAKLYLDYNEQNYVIADIRFIYDETEINPLEEKAYPEIISRNTIKEAQLLNMFVTSGFMLDQKNHRLVLANNEKIYEFLSEDIDSYMTNFEVLATENFKSKEIKNNTKISLGVKIENHLLDIDFSNLSFDPKELKDIMQQYKLKKKYYRLKDGSFIKLENNETIQVINSLTEDIDIDYSKIEDGNLKLPMYRALYLEKILEKSNVVRANKDDNFKSLIENIDVKEIEGKIETPKLLKANLREYQKIGVQWLRTLSSYGLGRDSC